MYRIIVLLLGVILVGYVASQENAPVETVKEESYTLFVVSSASNSVDVYDYQDRKTITSIPVGKNPRDIILSQDKKLAFVNNLDEGAVTVLDAENLTVLATIQVGAKPWNMKTSPNGRYLYVADYGEASVTVVDLDALKVVSKIKVGDAPVALSFAEEGRRVFVANSGSNDVTVIDTGVLKVIATIPVGPKPEYVVNNGDYVFVKNQGDNTISVIHVQLLDKPVDTFNADELADCGPLISNQEFTYTTILDKNLVLKLWADDLSVKAKIPVGERPYQFAFSPDYRIGFVTNSGSNDISVLNLTASKVIENLPTGKRPMGLAVI